MLSIQYISDTHVEFYGSRSKYGFVEPRGDILVMAGDICCATEVEFEYYKKFVNEYVTKFKHIILIAGNHEYYSDKPSAANTIQAVDKRLADFAASYKNVHYLNNKAIKLRHQDTDYVIIGSTLWTHIPKQYHSEMTRAMNDYSHICVQDKDKVRALTPLDVNAMHERSVNFIKRALARVGKARAIVITHHKPYDLTPEEDRSAVTYAYASDQKKLIEHAALWIFGHVHVASSVRIGGCRIVSNPRGYPYQRTMYNAERVVLV